MGFDFSKFQGVLRFALQILPADNLKGFKTQPTTKSQHQKHKEWMEWKYSMFIHICYSLISDFFSQNTTDHIQLKQLHHLSEMHRHEELLKTVNIQQKLF
jgi:hypothetical protein